jgi:hypothetical protein
VLENLCAAGEAVVDSWESGDLAGAVNCLDGQLDTARKLLGVPEGFSVQDWSTDRRNA